MSTVKKSVELRGQVLCFLELNWSFSQIIKHFKNKGINISRKTISNIKNGKGMKVTNRRSRVIQAENQS